MVGGHDEEVTDDEGMADDAGVAEVVGGGEGVAVEGEDKIAGDGAVGPPLGDVPRVKSVAAAKHGDAGEFALEDAGDGAPGEYADGVGAGEEVFATFGVAVGEDAGETGGDAEVLGVGGGEEFLGFEGDVGKGVEVPEAGLEMGAGEGVGDFGDGNEVAVAVVADVGEDGGATTTNDDLVVSRAGAVFDEACAVEDGEGLADLGGGVGGGGGEALGEGERRKEEGGEEKAEGGRRKREGGM